MYKKNENPKPWIKRGLLKQIYKEKKMADAGVAASLIY